MKNKWLALLTICAFVGSYGYAQKYEPGAATDVPYKSDEEVNVWMTIHPAKASLSSQCMAEEENPTSDIQLSMQDFDSANHCQQWKLVSAAGDKVHFVNRKTGHQIATSAVFSDYNYVQYRAADETAEGWTLALISGNQYEVYTGPAGAGKYWNAATAGETCADYTEGQSLNTGFAWIFQFVESGIAGGGTEPEPGTESGTGTEPGTEPEPEPEPGTESGTGTEPGTESGTEPETETGTEPEPGTETGTGTEPGTEPETGTGTEPEPKPEPGTGTEPGTEPEPEPGTETDIASLPNGICVYARDRRIYVEGEAVYQVYNIYGVRINSALQLPTGVYLVTVQGKTIKVIVR
ncbi:hypothetical protein AGMMS49525_01540 [Bacteroidia bacterium]|nr:hypothetical protein AGMMS49525_01540 [Bacteroidia bacterium]